jgi:hypothetical protein
MPTNRRAAKLWLIAILAVHLIISVIHGTAHDGAHVPLSPAATLFVFGVIVGAPIVGALLLWPAEQLGAWVVAASMAGAFLFGLVNHFILAGDDNVSHVAAAFQARFAITAVLLALTEALAAGLGFRLARK